MFGYHHSKCIFHNKTQPVKGSYMSKIMVVGSGNFGICLSNHLGQRGHHVTLVARSQAVADHINTERHHPKYLRKFNIDENVTAVCQADTVKDRSYNNIVLAVPTQTIRENARIFSDILKSATSITCASKGIEMGSGLTPTKILLDAIDIDQGKIAVLSGPSFAIEVMSSQPTCVAIASADKHTAELVQNLFHAPHFRCYTTEDTIGLEIAGAMKNVIAIAAGASAGLGYGSNTQAALITRGLAEITRFGVSKGANPLTFNGLGGVGDLFLTCNSDKSRNYKLGFSLSKGKIIDQATSEIGSIAEGVPTAKAIYNLANRTIDIPITSAVYKVLYDSADINKVVWELMSRESKPELTLSQ